MGIRVAELDGQNRVDNPYSETRIYRLFFEQISREILNGGRSTTCSYEFDAPEYLSARV